MSELRGGRYALVRTLGSGAQGDTFEALDRETGNLVAIKALKVAQAKAWKDVELAEREARTLATLEHDRIPRYLDHFEEEGTLYLVMQRIQGENLAALRKAGRAFSVAEVARMLEDASSALAYLHRRSPPVIHRDIKPGNVILGSDGSFSFVDFGCVRDRLKLEGGSTVVGTFGFMAPEQFQGRASAASDVYGVGATALAMLTGKEPEDLPHKGLAIDVRAALPKDVPEPLVRALEAMLAPDPDVRATSIGQALRLAPSKSKPPEPDDRRDPDRGDRKKNRRERRREKREAKRARRGTARLPLLPRIIVDILLLATRLVLWIMIGLVLPLVLVIFSLLFGGALRRAAAACWRAAGRSNAAIGRASRWLAGREEDAPLVRVAEADSDGARVRVAQSRVKDEGALAETELWDSPEAASAARAKRAARP
jgi:serine/threonine protein kinase